MSTGPKTVVAANFGPPMTLLSPTPIVFPCPMVRQDILGEFEPTNIRYQRPAKGQTLAAPEVFEVMGGDCAHCPFYEQHKLGICNPLDSVCDERYKDHSDLSLLLWLSERYLLVPVFSMPYGSVADIADTQTRPTYTSSEPMACMSRLLTLIRYFLGKKVELPVTFQAFEKLITDASNSSSPAWQRWTKGFYKTFEDERRILQKMQ